MVRIFKHKTKNILVLHFQYALNGSEKEPISRVLETDLKEIEPWHHIVIVNKNSAIEDKNFVIEMSNLVNKYSPKMLSFNVTGLYGIINFFFKMFKSFLKISTPIFIFDFTMEIEKKFDISFRNDFKDEFIEFT